MLLHDLFKEFREDHEMRDDERHKIHDPDLMNPREMR